MGRVCTELPPPEHHGPNPVPVHTRLPTPALPVDGRAIGSSSCGPLVPSKRESVGLSPHPPPTGSVETQRLHGCPTRSHSPLSPWGPGVVVHSGHTSPPALQEAESPLHWSVQDPEADKWGYLQTPTPPQVSYPSHIPCFPPETMLFSYPRSTRAGRASSSWNPGPTIRLPGPQHHGFAATGWPAGVSRGLGRIRTRGAVLGGPGRYSRPHAVTGVKQHPSQSSRTQRPGSPPSPRKGVRSRPWRRG